MSSKCSLFDIPINSIPGGTLPILIVDGKISLMALVYARYLKLSGFAPTTIYQKIKSIKLIWDFFLIKKQGSIDNKTFLMEFAEACYFGTNHIQDDALQWKKKTMISMDNILRDISFFSRFISNEFNAISLNMIEKKFKNTIDYKYIRDRKKTTDFLFHLDSRSKTYNSWQFKRKITYDNVSSYKSFPPNRIDDFFAACSSLRDELLYFLLAYGGIRISEALNLYIHDISIDRLYIGARIKLSHPSESKIIYKDENNRKKTITRQEYLLNNFRLNPRNLLASTDQNYAGWKGMLMHFKDETGLFSEVKWLTVEHGEHFYYLYKKYLETIRLHISCRHPYLFISETGQPLTKTAATKAFLRICSRIKLDNSNIHSLRHFYGFYCANVLKLNREVTKEMLHHKSLDATNKYYHLSQETIHNELEQAFRKLKYIESQEDLES